MIYERIKELCKTNGISVNELEKRLGVARGYLCKVDKHKPSSEKLMAIATELHTNVDYLIKGENYEFTVEMASIDVSLSLMDKRIKEYALKMCNLTPEKQEYVMNLIDMLSEGK